MLNKFKLFLSIKPDKASKIVSIIFDIMTIVGFSFQQSFSFKTVFGKPLPIILTVIYFIVFYAIISRAITLLYVKLDKNTYSYKLFPLWIEEHYFLFSFLVIAVSWIPYYIIYMPGSVPADGSYQLLEGTGILALTNSHSWVLSVWFGCLYRIFSNVSANFAIFIIVLLNGIFEALAYAYVLNCIHKLECPRWLNIMAIGLFAVNPCIASYSQAVLKDGLFYACIAVLAIQIVSILVRPDKNISGRDIIIITVVSMLLAITRRDGMARAIIAIMLMMIFLNKKGRVYMMLVASGLIIFQLLVGMMAADMGVAPGLKREPYSIPLQQVAKYIKEYPEKLTTPERRAIGRVLDVNNIADSYNPEISDYVKNTFNEDATEYEINRFIQIWGSMVRKHPVTCMEATISNSFGYFYPLYTFTQMRAYQLYNYEASIGTDELTYHYVLPASVRESVNTFLNTLRKIPVLGLLFSPGLYTWLIIIGLGYVSRTDRRKNFVFLFALVNILICMGSPVNGLIRYANTYIVLVPIAYSVIFGKKILEK